MSTLLVNVNIHICIFIGSIYIKKHSMPSGGSTKFSNLIMYIDTITNSMVSNHLTESGPIIASSYVVGSLLSNNNRSEERRVGKEC